MILNIVIVTHYQCSYTNFFYTAFDDCQNVLKYFSSVGTFVLFELFPHLDQCSGQVQLFVLAMLTVVWLVQFGRGTTIFTKRLQSSARRFSLLDFSKRRVFLIPKA